MGFILFYLKKIFFFEISLISGLHGKICIGCNFSGYESQKICPHGTLMMTTRKHTKQDHF